MNSIQMFFFYRYIHYIVMHFNCTSLAVVIRKIVKITHPSIHKFSVTAFPALRVVGMLPSVSDIWGQRWSFTLCKLPLHHRANTETRTRSAQTYG